MNQIFDLNRTTFKGSMFENAVLELIISSPIGHEKRMRRLGLDLSTGSLFKDRICCVETSITFPLNANTSRMFLLSKEF